MESEMSFYDWPVVTNVRNICVRLFTKNWLAVKIWRTPMIKYRFRIVLVMNGLEVAHTFIYFIWKCCENNNKLKHIINWNFYNCIKVSTKKFEQIQMNQKFSFLHFLQEKLILDMENLILFK